MAAVAVTPPTPEGYVHAGPVSDFLLSNDEDALANGTTIVNRDLNDRTNEGTRTEENTSASASMIAGCPATVTTSVVNQNACSGEENEHQINVVEIPQPAGRYPPVKRVAVTHFHGKWYAFLNICPHQGSALSRGSMTDIEDMGIVWGAGVTCSLHGWTFDALSGQSDSTRFVIDTFDVKEIDGHIFVSEKPRNGHVAGPRRDFGGREMN
ncbi:hypothetical protein BGX28_007941 [Mortierella sp. GBA30]|nr:hypothetical protein BGX28_007941 [Mortierella sp. GBA30]